MELQFADGHPFSCGSCPYRDAPLSENENTRRILIPISIDGIRTEAMVDTGGVYVICHPDFADSFLDLSTYDLIQENFRMAIPRWGIVEGNLYRVPLQFVAESGAGLELEATVFVPQPYGQRSLHHPIIGWMGCLEKIRFAADPSDDTFYFGSLGE